MATLLNGHIDPMYLKMQPSTTATAHIIAKYLPETNMPTKVGIHATYAKYLCSYMLHMQSMSIKNHGPVQSGTDKHTDNRW